MDLNGKAYTKGEKDDVVLVISEEEASKAKNQIRDCRDSLKDAGSCSFSKESESASPILASPLSNDPKDSDSGFSDIDHLKSKVSVSASTLVGSSPSPETVKFCPSPNKPPKHPQTETLTYRSLSRSMVSKPKSRYVELPYPSALKQVEEHLPTKGSTSPYWSSPNRAPPITPKENLKSTTMTPRSLAVEEEEEEIYESCDVPGREKWCRKLKFRVLFEWVSLLCATALLITSLTVNELQNFMIWGLEIWKWCLMVIVIFCGRLVSGWFIYVLVFLIELNFILKKKVLYFVHGLKRSVQVCIWSALVLLSWSLLFDCGVERSKTTSKVLNYVSRTLGTVLIGAVIWLVKTLLVKILASSFHVNTFFDRIQESIYHQYLLQTLSGPPSMEMAEQVGRTKSAQLSLRSVENGKGGEQQKVIDVGKLHKMKQEKVSAWTMKRLVNTITSSGLSTISYTIDESIDEEWVEQKDQEITSELEAKAAAYKIFKNVAKPNCKCIDVEDLMRFLSKEEVASVLPHFEGAAETGKIKKSALRNWVVKVYLERKSLAHSLNDTKTAVKQLNKLVTGVVIVLIIIIWLLLMEFASTKVLVFISSQILVVVFMFGNTCKTIFEGIIFIFVMHPFDVGDRCVIDGVQMVVEEMNILTTIFLRFDNEKIYYPNSVLATRPISNFYRSPNMGDSVEFAVDVSTSMDSIGALKERIKMYIESKPQHWQPNHNLVVKEIKNMNKMNMALLINHTTNFQNMGEKISRRSDLIFELKKIFEDLSIKYHLLPQEVHLRYIGSAMPPTLNFGQ
ncbi:mechanosensitive ion channel protein 10-like isoform X1 [Magnolia sinica]|uniref:mechanosensitive ion channel protein 10-like isoform X1 n=1 Tax=Magnolia sinica TaxID=86752 RepID=UPI00265A24E5|nr:mechanosensitive ion channel protein 10-like isoform X1 [Magnolia sinica]